MKHDRKLRSVALITEHDHNLAFDGIERLFRHNFQDLPARLETARIACGADFYTLADVKKAGQPINNLILGFHGHPKYMCISKYETLSEQSIGLLAPWKQILAGDATILLYSCSTGAEDKPIAKTVSAFLERDVFAPKFTLVPETDIGHTAPIGEFACTEDSRISFAYENFRHYKHILFKGYRYDNSIGTLAHGYSLAEDQLAGSSGLPVSPDALFLRSYTNI